MNLIIKIKETATMDRIEKLQDDLNHMKLYKENAEHLEGSSFHYEDVIESITRENVY